MTTFNSVQSSLDYLASQVAGGGAAARQTYSMTAATMLVNGIGASILGEQVTIPGSDTTGGSAVDPDDPNVLVLEWEMKDPAGTTFTRLMDETPGYMGDFRMALDVAEAVVPSGTDLSVYVYIKGQGTNNIGTQTEGLGMLFGNNADADLVDASYVARNATAVWSMSAALSGLTIDRTVGDLALQTGLGYCIGRRVYGTREKPRLSGFVQSTGLMVDTGATFAANFSLLGQGEFNDDNAAPTVPRLQMAFFRRTGATGDVIVAPTLSSYIQEHIDV